VPPLPSAPEERIAFDNLMKRAEAIEADHKELRKQEARRKHESEMKDLAVCEADVWRQVVARGDTIQTKGYDVAVCMLKKLA